MTNLFLRTLTKKRLLGYLMVSLAFVTIVASITYFAGVREMLLIVAIIALLAFEGIKLIYGW